MTGARLLYRDSNGGEAAVEIPQEGVFLGRGNDCAVRTDDAMVSRKNCRISLQAGRWVAEDLGSSNGTFVNGVRVQKQVLTHADVVRCGTLQVRFVENAPPPARVGPPDVAPHVDPAALLADRDQKIRESNESRDRLRGELEGLQHKLEEAQRRNTALAGLERENASLQAEVDVQMRISDGLRLEVESLRDKLDKGHARAEELEAELKLARAASADLRARMEMEVDGHLAGPTSPMPVAKEAAPLMRSTTLPFPILAPVLPPAEGMGGATVPEMPAVSGDDGTVAVDQALAELRASLVVARTLVAEPGVVPPSTARAVVVALDAAARRADEAQAKLRALRDGR